MEDSNKQSTQSTQSADSTKSNKKKQKLPQVDPSKVKQLNEGVNTKEENNKKGK